MNRDQLKGKGKDIAGRVERQVGEWTDSGEHQAKGAGKQIEGKGQQLWGKMKQAGSDAKRDLEGRGNEEHADRDVRDRDRKAA